LLAPSKLAVFAGVAVHPRERAAARKGVNHSVSEIVLGNEVLDSIDDYGALRRE
jgi:hypothetical protein